MEGKRDGKRHKNAWSQKKKKMIKKKKKDKYASLEGEKGREENEGETEAKNLIKFVLKLDSSYGEWGEICFK